jgi:hypothetical protein
MWRIHNLKVLTAGGGIGGLTARLALRARGIDAELRLYRCDAEAVLRAA